MPRGRDRRSLKPSLAADQVRPMTNWPMMFVLDSVHFLWIRKWGFAPLVSRMKNWPMMFVHDSIHCPRNRKLGFSHPMFSRLRDFGFKIRRNTKSLFFSTVKKVLKLHQSIRISQSNVISFLYNLWISMWSFYNQNNKY